MTFFRYSIHYGRVTICYRALATPYLLRHSNGDKALAEQKERRIDFGKIDSTRWGRFAWAKDPDGNGGVPARKDQWISNVNRVDCSIYILNRS
jgi:hypothetical protein